MQDEKLGRRTSVALNEKGISVLAEILLLRHARIPDPLGELLNGLLVKFERGQSQNVIFNRRRFD